MKHRLLREEPKGKFLLYHEGPQPQDLDNWLLDILLAYGQFRTDQVSLWLSELGLEDEFYEVVQDHIEFFGAVKRHDALKKLLKDENTFVSLKMNMLSVCSSSEMLHNLVMNASKISLLSREALFCGVKYSWGGFESSFLKPLRGAN